MKYNCRIIVWRCSCGNAPSSVRVGVNSLGQLMGFWFCQNCGCDAQYSIPLTKLAEDMPEAPLQEDDEQKGDKSFLADLHISEE